MSEHLIKIEPGMITVGEPIPFNIHSADGTLLLHAGTILYASSQIDGLIERHCYTIPVQEEPESQQIESLVYRIDYAFNRFVVNGDNIYHELVKLADDLTFYTRHNPDALIGIIHLHSHLKYSVIRAIQNTVLSVLLAIRLGWNKGDEIASGWRRSAITMNGSTDQAT